MSIRWWRGWRRWHRRGRYTNSMTHYRVTFDTVIFVEHKNEKIDLRKFYTAKFQDKFLIPYAVSVSEKECPGITKITIQRDGYGMGRYGAGYYGGNLVKETTEIEGLNFSTDNPCSLFESDRGENLKSILSIICANNQWSRWDYTNLNQQQLNKLNDALIFECHVYSQHEIFVSNDGRSFSHGGSAREKLNETFHTQVYNLQEFENICDFS